MASQRLLITGGLGYIGSHVAKRLGSLGYHVGIFDNLSSGCAGRLAPIQDSSLNVVCFLRGDIRNQTDLASAFDRFRPDAVMHLAGQKVVSQSFKSPEKFHSTNVIGTSKVLKAASEFGCHKFVFSSSAAVYGHQPTLTVRENAELFPLSPYGETKVLGERCVRDWVAGDPLERSSVILRYFNPCGCDASLLAEENTRETDLSLSEKLVLIASKRQSFLEVFGTDHPTPDGTPVRDFIHIEDVVDAHVAALHAIDSRSICEVLNVGTGAGTSVLQLVRQFEAISGIKIPIRQISRVPADLSNSRADTTKSSRVLRWRAQHPLAEMCKNLNQLVTIDTPQQRTSEGSRRSSLKDGSSAEKLEHVKT